MNNKEYLDIFLDNVKVSLKRYYDIDMDPEYIDELKEKYYDPNGDANEIGNQLSAELTNYVEREKNMTDDSLVEEEVVEPNEIDINMMKIASSKNPEELQSVISAIPKLESRLKDYDMSDKEFENTKRGLFDIYKNGLDKDEKNMKGLGFETMEEYKEYADGLGENVEVVDDTVKEDSELDIMFNEMNENNMVKEEEVVKENPKVLTITPPSEKGFAYSPAINITILVLLIVFFMIVLITFV